MSAIEKAPATKVGGVRTKKKRSRASTEGNPIGIAEAALNPIAQPIIDPVVAPQKDKFNKKHPAKAASTYAPAQEKHGMNLRKRQVKLPIQQPQQNSYGSK
eukprot:gb/GEZN01024735.1/.p1 GENE.gb/GEZN01024735.1/~~gb/GEZN01024735.1/.p1  ORF type:complete len:101 (+),score=17.63 gb/GEZN01024735.1/:43-345(+)